MWSRLGEDPGRGQNTSRRCLGIAIPDLARQKKRISLKNPGSERGSLSAYHPSERYAALFVWRVCSAWCSWPLVDRFKAWDLSKRWYGTNGSRGALVAHTPLPPPQDFFHKNMQFSGKRKTPLFWANFGFRVPLWVKTLLGTLDQNPGFAPVWVEVV